MNRIFTTIEIPKPDHSEQMDAGPFPIDAFPPVMRCVAESLAEVHKIDVALPAMSALATLSGSIGKSVTVSGVVNGRTTHCNLYVVAGAPKSYGKGAASEAVKPIIEASAERLDHFQKYERADLQTDRELLEEIKKKQLSDCKNEMKSVGSCNKEALKKTNQELEQITWLLECKARPGYHIGSVTGAALEEHLVRNDETAFSFSPEAGDTIRIALGKFSKDGSADIDLFLMGFSVETYSSGRAGRGFKTLMPCISTLWMCQPSLLRELYSSKEAHERGFTARCLSFICEHDEIPYNDGIVREVDQRAVNDWNRLVLDTLEGRKNLRNLPTDAAARTAFQQWDNESISLRNGLLRDIEGEAGRWLEHSIRIAGVLAVASGCDRICRETEPLCRFRVILRDAFA